MKKILIMMAFALMSIAAIAFEFDGIDLNGNVVDISKKVAQKGYVFDPESGRLTGNCAGIQLYISMEYDNVTEPGKLGRFIVDIPMNNPSAVQIVASTFAVIYHSLPSKADSKEFLVSNDGTVASVQAINNGVRLVYTTPYCQK